MYSLFSGIMGGRIWKNVWKDEETESGLGVVGSVLREHVASVGGRGPGAEVWVWDPARGVAGCQVDGFHGEESTGMAREVGSRVQE